MLSLLTSLALSAPAQAGVSASWSLEDPTLAAALERALADNPDLQTARARAARADHLAEQALASRLPAASVDVNGSLSPTDSLGFQFGGLPSGPDMPDRYGTGQALLTVSYEVDLWGRHWLSHRASRHEAAAVEGDRRATELSIATLTASSWLSAVTAAQRLAVVQEQVQLNAELLELVELRQQRGEGTALDVLQQRQQLAATRALVPRVELLSQTSRYTLATLVGAEPGTEVTMAEALPEPGPDVPTLDEAILDQSRPDVLAARDRASGATDTRKAALRTALPALRVQGQAGWLGFYMDEFDTQQTWGASAALSVPVFNGGAAHATWRAAQEQEQAALSALQSAELTALEEARGAVARLEAARAERDAVKAQEEAARLAFEEARQRYLRGLVPYLTVTTALAAWQRAQLDALEAHRALLDARIQLNDALAVQVLD